jgi:hypothetical protein
MPLESNILIQFCALLNVEAFGLMPSEALSNRSDSCLPISCIRPHNHQ